MMQARLADKQEELKLDILQSLARSQRALTVILESVANVTSARPPDSKQICGHLDVLAKYQVVIAEKLTGIRLRTCASSPPGIPWINEASGVSGPFIV